jgi:predicted PurR-regulated permease PerM
MVFPGMSDRLDRYARLADLAVYFHYRARCRNHGNFCPASPVHSGIRQNESLPGLFGGLRTDFLYPVRTHGFFVGVLSREAYDLYVAARNAVFSDRFQSLVEGSLVLEKINAVLVHFNIELTGRELYQGISEIGKYVGLFLYDQARAIASNMLAFIVNFFLMLLVIYYLLIDGSRLVDFIVDLSPLPDDQEYKLIEKFKDMAGAILVGNGLCGLIQGVLGGTAFYFLGLKSPFLWGVIMGILAFLPIHRHRCVFLPAAMYLFLTGHCRRRVFLMVFYVLLSGGIEYLFKPKLVGSG